MDAFKKLNITIDPLNTELIRGQLVWSSSDGLFSEYSIKDKQYFQSEFLDKFNFKIPPDQMNFAEMRYPGVGYHCDPWPVTLNYYITDQGDETSFYERVNHSGNIISVEPQGLIIYGPENIKKIDSFIANAGDIFVFNTHKIHNVVISEPRSLRQMVRLCWSVSTGITFDNFDTVFA